MLGRTARRLGKATKYTCVAGGIGAAMILLPPRESLPSEGLLQTRVLLEGIGRVLRCAKTGVVILVDYKWNTRGEMSSRQDVWDDIHVRSAKRLVQLAETNGGLYVKSGQVFASMSHILPRQYTDTMRVLQDAVVKRPFSEIQAVIEQDLGCPINDVFASLDETPLAAASLAQVHKGILRSDRTEVAVKVQYIDILQRFRGDMATIRLMLGVCGAAFPGYDFSAIVSRLNNTMAQELDFVGEAKNAERAARELKPVFGTKVVTPFIHWKYCTRRVMVTDFVNGVKISDAEGMRRLGISVPDAASLCYSALAYQLFLTGFAHADPHAGNILVHKPKTNGHNWRRGETQVVLLDHGLYVNMSPEIRHRLAQIWTAAVTHRTEELAAVSRELGIKDHIMLGSMFLQHPYEFFSSFKTSMSPKELDLMHNQAQEKMEEINQIIECLPAEYALVLRSLTALRAINKELGNPVRRPLILLKYSLQESHKASAFGYWKAATRAWWEESKTDAIMAFLKWYRPRVYEVVEDALAMA